MTSAIGWYGPLIDLSKAESQLGSFVQLLVFVHRTSPVQYKLSKGGEVIRTDIQVGDNTRPYFSVSLWQKQMASMAVAGDVVLLQNIKIIKFRGLVEATTVQCSSLLRLIHPYESLISKGLEDLVAGSQVGIATKEKLRKVVEWVQRVGSTIHNIEFNADHAACQKRQSLRNWKVPEVGKSFDCFSLTEVLGLSDFCKANFTASIGDIFVPITWRALDESEKEKMFISRRLSSPGDDKFVEDLICIGCQLCGSPLGLEYSRSMNEQNSIPLHCQKSSNRLHVVSLIYRPFMLYIWDKSEYLPILVRNKAAELLFGSIRAESVYRCYKGQDNDQNPCSDDDQKDCFHDARPSNDLQAAAREVVSSGLAYGDKILRGTGKYGCCKNMNFYLIWLILLRTLLQGKNSSLKFEVDVNARLDRDNGRFEMISMSIPCFRT